MAKRLFPLLLAWLLVAGCSSGTPEPLTAPPAPEQEQGAAAPTFTLPKLPQLASFAAAPEIVSRYAAQPFVDTLVAAEDYGKLYPYVGKKIGSDFIGWAEDYRYGLVDEQGRIVVDPVYQYASYTRPIDGGEPAYLTLSYPIDESDEAALLLAEKSYTRVRRGRYQFASLDGRWVSDIYYGDEAWISEDRIIIMDYGDNLAVIQRHMDDIGQSENNRYRLYDLEGRLIATGQGFPWTGFKESLALVRHGSYDAQNDSYLEYYNYIDKQGRVAIAGPFLDAGYFEQGRARVAVGEDDAGRYLYSFIDRKGNYLSEPAANTYYNYGDAYLEFKEGELYGLLDLDGHLVLPAAYQRVNFSSLGQPAVALGQKPDGSYWLIDLINGPAREITLNVNNAAMVGNDWCVASYYDSVVTPEQPEGGQHSGLVFIRGDTVHYVDYYGYITLDCQYIGEDLFALNYFRSNEQRVDFFNAASGRVLQSMEGFYYSHSAGSLFVLREHIRFTDVAQRLLALKRDFSPACGPDMPGGEALTGISHVADDVYALSSSLFSGLLRENGEWLIRVRIDNTD